MARIRSIKPDFFRHHGLFVAEKESGLPLRVAFAGLWTVADREGRFRWRVDALKLDCLPYDDVSFVAVLEALASAGFIVRYGDDGAFGFIPTFKDHQHVNLREPQSSLPPPVSHGATCMHVRAHGEREGEIDSDSSSLTGTPLDLKKELFSRGVTYLKTNGLDDAKARSLIGLWRKHHGDAQVLMALMSAEGAAVTDTVPYVTAVLQGRMKPHVATTNHPRGVFGAIGDKLREAQGKTR